MAAKSRVGRVLNPDITGEHVRRGWEWFRGVGEGRVIPNWIKTLLGFLFIVVRSLLVLFLVGILIYLGYSWLTAGTVDVGVTHAQVAGKEVAQPLWKKLSLERFTPQGALEASSFNTEVEKNELSEDLGVRITKLEPFSRIFSGEPIELIGTIEVESLPEQMLMEVTCSLEDYPNNEIIPAELLLPGATSNRATIYKGQKEVIQATCLFDQGIIIEDGADVFTAKIAAMYVNYEFETKATHKIYTLSSVERQKFSQRGIDAREIFEDSGINEPLLTSDGRMKSKYSAGPIALGITTEQSQPFSENVPYIFKVALTNNLDWYGSLKYLKSLEIQVPYYVALEGDPGFRAASLNSQCAFENTGQTVQDSNQAGDTYYYKVYRLKDEVKEQINKDCSVEALKNSQLTREECIDIYKQKPFRCKFMIENHAPPTMQWDDIRAVARYIYETEKNKPINIVKIPEYEEEGTSVFKRAQDYNEKSMTQGYREGYKAATQ